MKEAPTADELLQQAIELFMKDRFAAVELLNPHDPQLAATTYGKLQMEFYWKRKDLPLTVAISQAGIQQALTAAGRASDEESARALRGSAKMLAFNLASFTWPGWDEQGIAIGASELAAGLDAARLNLRLAKGLDRPAKAKANAWWVLGAQQLAISDYPSARESFAQAKLYAEQAEPGELASAMAAYGLMTLALADPANALHRASFDRALSAIRADPSEDGAEYARQLTVAIEYFTRGD